MSAIDDKIDQRIGEVRTEGLDISFGEIINLYTNQEIIISPEYQRLFRWSLAQQSRLIESVLLELPIPPIFVIENTDGVLELVDGLQRISSMIHFMEPSLLQSDDTALKTEALRFEGPLKLQDCDLVKDLNGQTYEGLSLRLKLRLRRSTVRMVLIRRQSTSILRYEMFKRLNTGGSQLSPQEIRNCTARMIGDPGIRFYRFLQECARNSDFEVCTETLAEADRMQKGDEELVLRFFALKNARDLFQGSVRDWLDAYMENVILGRALFDYDREQAEFSRLFKYITQTLGVSAFVRYRGNYPIGGLAPAYFEAVTMGVYNTLEDIDARQVPGEALKSAVSATVQSELFRGYTGPAANSKQKLQGRITTIESAIRAISQ